MDDESKADLTMFNSECPTPDQWTSSKNPPYRFVFTHCICIWYIGIRYIVFVFGQLVFIYCIVRDCKSFGVLFVLQLVFSRSFSFLQLNKVLFVEGSQFF